MPAIPLIAIYAGATAAAAGTMTLAGVLAGAVLVGGVVSAAGYLKGGSEGDKWTKDGNMLSAVAGLGMSMGIGSGSAAGAEAGAAADGAAATSGPVATGTDAAFQVNGAQTVGSPVDAVAGGMQTSADPLLGANTGGSGFVIGGNSSGIAGETTGILGTPGVGTGAAGTPGVNVVPPAGNNLLAPTSQSIATENLAAAQARSGNMQMAAGLLNGYSQGNTAQAQIDAQTAEAQRQRNFTAQQRAASQYNPNVVYIPVK